MDEKIEFHFPTKILEEKDFLPININVLINYYRNTFFQLIDKVSKIYKHITQIGNPNSQRLLIDQYSFGLLNHLLTPDDFKDKNFNQNNITILDGKEKDLNFVTKFKEENMIYIIKPNKKKFDSILLIHTMLKSVIPNLKAFIIFIPCENYDIIKHMKTSHIRGDFHIENLNIDLIPIDLDLLSLEKDNSLKEIYIDNDLTSINDLANSVVKLEMIFGKIKYKYIKGDFALKFCNLLQEKELENNLKKGEDEILALLAFDRSVDFITLMASNYTCEGVIDDIFGINFGRIKVKENLLKKNLSKKPITSEKLISFGLTTAFNKLYCSFRCMHYLDAIKYIVKIREYYKKIMDKSKNSKNNISMDDIQKFSEEIHYFVKNIKDSLIMNENIINYITQYLTDDINRKRYIEKEQLLLSGDLPNNLYDFYDELLCEKKDLNGLIRLMIIESLTQNGIKDYYRLKREILNIYGYQNIFVLRDLETLGWLKERQIFKSIKKNITTITYTQVIDKLKLINLENDNKNIKDCSYVMGGFCPLSLKIVEKAVEGQWSTINDVLKKLPGATFFPEDESEIKNPKKEKNIIFLIFIGGITYTEIEGIRFLNRKFNEENKIGKRKKTQFIILTTGILNSEKIFSSLNKDTHSSFTLKKFYEELMKEDKKK